MENLDTNKLTLIKRTSPICPMCVAMQMALEGEGIPFNTIDITEKPEVIEEYNISSVPVLLIKEDNGNEIKLNGIQPVDVIREFLD